MMSRFLKVFIIITHLCRCNVKFGTLTSFGVLWRENRKSGIELKDIIKSSSCYRCYLVLRSVSPYSVQMREKTDHKNSKYGHFSCSDMFDRVLNTFNLWRKINPFLANVSVLYVLRIPESEMFSDVFRGYRMGKLARNGLMINYKYEFQKFSWFCWSVNKTTVGEFSNHRFSHIFKAATLHPETLKKQKRPFTHVIQRVFLKISYNTQENSCTGDSFLIKLQAWKHLYGSLFFNKVAGLKSAPLLKQRLRDRCFPVNLGKYLGTIFLQNTPMQLLLNSCLGKLHKTPRKTFAIKVILGLTAVSMRVMWQFSEVILVTL